MSFFSEIGEALGFGGHAPHYDDTAEKASATAAEKYEEQELYYQQLANNVSYQGLVNKTVEQTGQVLADNSIKFAASPFQSTSPTFQAVQQSVHHYSNLFLSQAKQAHSLEAQEGLARLNAIQQELKYHLQSLDANAAFKNEQAAEQRRNAIFGNWLGIAKAITPFFMK